MIGAVESNNSINTIRFFNATNAFNKSNNIQQAQTQEREEAGTEIKENSFLKNINVSEIKEYANSVGETGLNEDDIKYGLKYGRSVLIDYSV